MSTVMCTLHFEVGGQIDVIYTDFEKAFDKVPHKRYDWNIWNDNWKIKHPGIKFNFITNPGTHTCGNKLKI